MNIHHFVIIGIWVSLGFMYLKLYKIFSKSTKDNPVDFFNESMDIYLISALIGILFIILPMVYSMYIINN